MSDDADRMDELTRYRHGLAMIGQALVASALPLPEFGRTTDDLRRVTEKVMFESEDVDLLVLEWLVTLTAICLANRTGETPRSVFERKFGLSPYDVEWRANFNPRPR